MVMVMLTIIAERELLSARLRPEVYKPRQFWLALSCTALHSHFPD